MEKYPFDFSIKCADINVGLIGNGIQESRSPLMHMKEASAQGLSLHYRLFDLEGSRQNDSMLPALLDEIEAIGYRGVNVTHPYKQAIIAYLDELSNEAADLGAVNTVVFEKGKRYGHNTDWSGFYISFIKALTGVVTDKVLQLGAGGAGSAVAYALARTGVEALSIYDLDRIRANNLALRLSLQFPAIKISVPENIESVLPFASGVINTTPVGMKSYPGIPLPATLLLPQHWVVDVIYFPLETALLELARELGCKTMDGSGMAIHQAAEAFRLFTGREADAKRMSGFFSNAR